MPQYDHPSANTNNIEYPIIKSIEKFKNHQSIQLKVVFLVIVPSLLMKSQNLILK